MSDQHFETNPAFAPAAFQGKVMRDLANAWDAFTRLRGIMIQSKDVGQTGDAEFASIAIRYGYAGDNAAAQNEAAADSFAQIDTAFQAGNASITQMLNSHL